MEIKLNLAQQARKAFWIFALLFTLVIVGCSNTNPVTSTPTLLQRTLVTTHLTATGTTIPTQSILVATSTPEIATPTPKALFVSTPIPTSRDVISVNNAKDVTELATWGRGKANYVTYSPDGQTLAIAASTGVYFYDAKTLVDKSQVVTTNEVTGVAFSPDSLLLAITFAKGGVQLWQATDGTMLRTLERETGIAGGSPVFSPDGLFLATGSGDRAVRLWRVSDGKLIRTFRGHIDIRSGYTHGEENRSTIAFSPDGKLMATTDIFYENVWIWQTSDGSLLHKLKGNCVAFSGDGKLFAAGEGYYFRSPASVEVWRVSDWSLQYTLDEQEHPVGLLKFSPDSRILMTNNRLWDMTKGQLVKDLQISDRDRFSALEFSPDNTMIASISRDGRIQVRQILNLENSTSLFGYMNMAHRVVFSPDETLLATGDDWSIQIWRVSDGALLRNIDHGTGVDELEFSPDGKILASGNLLDGLRLWDAGSGTLLKSLKSDDYLDSIKGLAFSSDGTLLAASGVSRGVQIWNVSSGQLMSTLDSTYAEKLVFSPDGKLLAVSGYQTIQIWQLSTNALIQTLKRNSYTISSMRFSPDGNDLLVTGDLNTVLWDIKTGKQQANLPIRGNALSPDLNILVSFYQRDWTSGKVVLWQFPQKVSLNSLEVDAFVTDVAFSPNGQYLAAGLRNGTVEIWGIKR